MKHIPLTTLCVAISAVLLTACGGSSGGSNPPAPTPIPNAGGSGSTGTLVALAILAVQAVLIIQPMQAIQAVQTLMQAVPAHQNQNIKMCQLRKMKRLKFQAYKSLPWVLAWL